MNALDKITVLFRFYTAFTWCNLAQPTECNMDFNRRNKNTKQENKKNNLQHFTV